MRSTISLNAAILGPDARPGTPEFDLFIKEVAKEMTVKAGQKCTAIRRAFAPVVHTEAVIEALRQRLAKIQIGNPELETVRMGPVVGLDQRRDVLSQIEKLKAEANIIAGDPDNFSVEGADKTRGAFCRRCYCTAGILFTRRLFMRSRRLAPSVP